MKQKYFMRLPLFCALSYRFVSLPMKVNYINPPSIVPFVFSPISSCRERKLKLNSSHSPRQSDTQRESEISELIEVNGEIPVKSNQIFMFHLARSLTEGARWWQVFERLQCA